MTAQELLYDARALLDEYNSGGVPLSAEETAEIDTNAIRYIYSGLCEIYPYARFYKSETIQHRPTDEQRNDGTWLEYDMPSDLGDIERMAVVNKRYELDVISQLEGNKLYISPCDDLDIRITYKPRPTRPAITDELPIKHSIAEQFMVYYVAAKIAITELPDHANFLEQKSNELLMMAMRAQPAKEVPIVDVYFRGRYGEI